MKKYMIILAMGLMLAGCGKDKSARDLNDGRDVEQAAEESTEQAADQIIEANTEPSTEENTEGPAVGTVPEPEEKIIYDDYENELSKAKSSDKGSSDNLSGKYNITHDGETYNGIQYVFLDDSYSIIEYGTYSMNSSGLTMKHGTEPESAFKIQTTDEGYNLTNDTGNLIPLVYKEGTDGLSGSEPFDGVYSMSSSQGYIFHKDGTLETVRTDSFKSDERTVKLGTQVYDWKKVNNGIELSTNGTILYTFVPAN